MGPTLKICGMMDGGGRKGGGQFGGGRGVKPCLSLSASVCNMLVVFQFCELRLMCIFRVIMSPNLELQPR